MVDQSDILLYVQEVFTIFDSIITIIKALPVLLTFCSGLETPSNSVLLLGLLMTSSLTRYSSMRRFERADRISLIVLLNTLLVEVLNISVSVLLLTILSALTRKLSVLVLYNFVLFSTPPRSE